MKKQNSSKLLDLWAPSLESGDPIGCLATSFTFESEFFEEECLGRFVKMESDPFSDGPVYLIEREEKFSGIKATVLVDQNHCKGKRSLRWDLITFRNKSLLHAKVSFLFWANHLRVIIGSANISKSGYRYNQEVFGVLDFKKGSDIPLFILEQIIGYMKSLVSNSGNSPEQPEIQKWNLLLDQSWERREYFTSAEDYQGFKEMRAYPLFTMPGKESLFDQVTATWNKCTNRPPRNASITSPFFDEAAPNKPANAVWKLLAQKGEAGVTYNLIVNSTDPKEKLVSVNAPRSIDYKPASRAQVKVEFNQIKEGDLFENRIFKRPVHQKSIWLEGDDWALYLVGSSNFTSAGTGLSVKSNFEANLAYIISSSRNKKGYELLVKSYPETSRLKKITNWRQIPNEDEELSKDIVPLPLGFLSAYYDLIKSKPILLLTFDSSKMPKGFAIYDEKENLIYNEEKWISQGKKSEVNIPWTEKFLPSELKVKWLRSPVPAWWPVNIINQASLPVPEELKELPLEVLLHILASSRPAYQLIKRHLKSKENLGSDQVQELDALKRVDNYDFLLQRTRRISYALNTMKYKLEKPLYTLESLQWRLYGPVGVHALCDAIIKESKSKEETLFLLSEIALELSEINPQEAENSLDKKMIKAEIKKLIDQIHKKTKSYAKQLKIKSLDLYIKDTFKKISHEV